METFKCVTDTFSSLILILKITRAERMIACYVINSGELVFMENTQGTMTQRIITGIVCRHVRHMHVLCCLAVVLRDASA